MLRGRSVPLPAGRVGQHEGFAGVARGEGLAQARAGSVGAGQAVVDGDPFRPIDDPHLQQDRGEMLTQMTDPLLAQSAIDRLHLNISSVANRADHGMQ